MPLPWYQMLGDRAARPDPLVRDLLALTERRDGISFSVGLPAPELLPLADFSQLLATLSDEVGPALLLHSPTEGHSPLRETLAQWLKQRGIVCSPSEVLVLSGSQQGLDLVARTFIAPGDVVFVEQPSFFGALQAFRNARARIVGIGTDEQGLRTDQLAMALRQQRPKLIYTLPTFQNPSSAVLSIERRLELLDLAYRYQVPVLEDDPYSELRFRGESLPSLKALDRAGYVIYLSTFSKVLYPGLRLGHLVAPAPAIRQLALVKQTADLHSNTPGQWLLDRFISEGRYEPHVRRLRSRYGARCERMHEALRRAAVPDLSWSKPQGGFYLWCRLPTGTERPLLLARAAELGVSFLPGWSCFVDELEHNYIRLNFSFPAPEQIDLGIERLSEAIAGASAVTPAGHLVHDPIAGTPPIV